MSLTLSLLALRVLIGGLFLMHGWSKYGSNHFQKWVASMLPLPEWLGEILGVSARSAEFIGGIALLLGFGLWTGPVLLITVMLGAIATVHRQWNPDGQKGGWEYCAVLIAALLVLISTGFGPYAIDAILP